MAEKKTTTKKETVKKAPVAKAAKPAVAKEAKATKAALPEFKGKYLQAVGKRKSATAQVRLFTKGSGQIIVNGMPYDQYFGTTEQRIFVLQAIKLVGAEEMDFSIIVSGGGKSGQAEAVRNGLAKCFLEHNPELRGSLKSKGWLTRDARKKERKKPGLKKARKAPQWSKR